MAAPVDPANYSKPVQVACVGDSITVGIANTPGNDWPAQLQKMLGDKWVVKNYGQSGHTMMKRGDLTYWDQGPFKASQASNPDVVIIMLGTNDSKPQNWKIHDPDFARDYRDFVILYKALPSHPHIYICYPPPGPPPGNWGINEPVLLQEQPILDKIAADQKADIIDTHAPLVGKNLQPDTVHPNDAGAKLIAQAVYAVL